VGSTEHKAPHYVVFPTVCHLIPLRPKYPSQHSILKHPPAYVPPTIARPSLRAIQNRQNYNSVCLDPYIFGQQTGRQKILHWMISTLT